jgi:3-oxoacyl-[acyl-carrier-protein] synthase-1
VTLSELGLVCALGQSKAPVVGALREGVSPGMRKSLEHSPDGRSPLHLGRVDAVLPSLAHLPLRYQSRNNQLLAVALGQIRPAVEAAREEYGPQRVGVVMGTSTSGVAQTEAAYFARAVHARFPKDFHYGQMEVGSPSGFLCEELKLTGPSFTVSTACSSSANALVTARRLLRAGLCDAVLAGGADALCRMTTAGFSALEAVSANPCRPFRKGREGINIGEGAALFLLKRDGKGPVLAGVGQSSDAHHLSAPLPTGLGARLAMEAALKDAGLEAPEVGYLNAHGTATPQNDAMEARAILEVLGDQVPVSSTKPLTGHTLGAAGALEAALCALVLEHAEEAFLPPQLGEGEWDDALPRLNFVTRGQRSARPLRAVMSNSFGFGGSNTSIILALRPS